MQNKLILLSFVFIGFSTSAQVQRNVVTKHSSKFENNKTDSAGIPDKVYKKALLKELNLTKEQRSRLKEIRQANKSERDEIMNNETLTEAQKAGRLKEAKRSAANNLREVLNDEQKSKLKSMRKAQRNNNRNDTIPWKP